MVRMTFSFQKKACIHLLVFIHVHLKLIILKQDTPIDFKNIQESKYDLIVLKLFIIDFYKNVEYL